jgi:CRP-like cAMP-binding protein
MFEHELRGIEIFRDLTDGELRRLSGLFEEVSLPANHVVFRQGDDAEAFYVIKDGDVVIFRDEGEDEPVQLLARLGPGDHFGEFGIHDELIRSASARTSEPSHILTIGKKDLLGVLLEHPTVALRLQTAAARRQGSAKIAGFARRREVRTIVDKEVMLTTEDGTAIKARLVNLSQGGMCLRGVPARWSVGQRVRFHLGLGNGLLQLGGEVTWVRGDLLGLTFRQRSHGHPTKIQWALRQLVGQKREALAWEGGCRTAGEEG